MVSRKEGQTVYYRVTNMKFIEACALIRQALVEQHLAQGESLQAAELLDAAGRQPAIPVQRPVSQSQGDR